MADLVRPSLGDGFILTLRNTFYLQGGSFSGMMAIGRPHPIPNVGVFISTKMRRNSTSVEWTQSIDTFIVAAKPKYSNSASV